MKLAEAKVDEQIRKRPKTMPFSRKHSADFTLARMCYALVRTFKPEIVVETGVAYGVTTTFILQALDDNQSGTLHSIDLPPSIRDDAAQFVGMFVPESLRGRWRLHLGTSARILPSLLTELRQIDFFVHDSLHTYRNMIWEFRTAHKYFGSTATLISDDVQGNAAFSQWVEETKPACWAVIQESRKEGAFGVSVILPEK